jgi:hypothetical protein
MRRIVEPGEMQLWVGADCLDDVPRRTVVLSGPVFEVGDRAPLTVQTTIGNG